MAKYVRAVMSALVIVVSLAINGYVAARAASGFVQRSLDRLTMAASSTPEPAATAQPTETVAPSKFSEEQSSSDDEEMSTPATQHIDIENDDLQDNSDSQGEDSQDSHQAARDSQHKPGSDDSGEQDGIGD